MKEQDWYFIQKKILDLFVNFRCHNNVTTRADYHLRWKLTVLSGEDTWMMLCDSSLPFHVHKTLWPCKCKSKKLLNINTTKVKVIKLKVNYFFKNNTNSSGASIPYIGKFSSGFDFHNICDLGNRKNKSLPYLCPDIRFIIIIL